jgi:hypothetical protein
MKNLIRRAKAPTPAFFRKLRNAGLVLAGIASALLTAPVSLPPLFGTIAGYLLTAGSIVTAVSQLTVEEGTEPGKDASAG